MTDQPQADATYRSGSNQAPCPHCGRSDALVYVMVGGLNAICRRCEPERPAKVTDQPQRHPVSLAWDAFRTSKGPLFEGSADGRYLQNRLEAAFEAGWEAAQEAVRKALGDR